MNVADVLIKLNKRWFVAAGERDIEYIGLVCENLLDGEKKSSKYALSALLFCYKDIDNMRELRNG